MVKPGTMSTLMRLDAGMVFGRSDDKDVAGVFRVKARPADDVRPNRARRIIDSNLVRWRAESMPAGIGSAPGQEDKGGASGNTQHGVKLNPFRVKRQR